MNQSYLAVAREAAREAGDIVKRLSTDNKPVSIKGRGNVTTLADQAAETAVIARIKAAFPDHAILAEESGGAALTAGPTWVIDPLDGTFNYATGIPLYAISIALVVDGQPVAGVVYDPSRDELFEAARGSGAQLNGQPIAVSSAIRLADCVLGFDLGYHDVRARHALLIANQLWGQYQYFRTIGTVALGLAYAACGRFGVYFHHFVAPWDFAAGWLLIEEAGGIVSSYGGQPVELASTAVLAASPTLHRQFVEAIRPLGDLPAVSA